MNPAQHISQAVKNQKKVLLRGTAALSLPEGFGLCYDRDYNYGTAGAATDNEGRRDKIVQVPDSTNHEWFAGVLDHPVVIPLTGEILVTINEPGSVCEIAIGGQSAAVGVTRFTCSCGGADAGRFTLAGLGGRGTAIALQTSTAKATFMDGGAAYTTADKTLTKSGAFTGVVAGDRAVIVGFDGGTVGIYTVASRTDNTLVFATDIGGAANRAKVTGYVIGSSETRILAKLLDGAESGLQEVVQTVAGTAFSMMAGGGYSYIAPGTLTTAATSTVADGTHPGQRKAIHCLGACTTDDAAVTFTHHGTSDPEVLYFDAAGELTVVDWYGAKWMPMALTAATS